MSTDRNLADFNGVVRSVPDRSSAEPENQAEALRKIVYDALDLSEELRNECTDAVIAALASLPEPAEVLPYVVEYRRIDTGITWIPMAAFDVEGVAEKYAADCGRGNTHWEYRAIRRAPHTQQAGDGK
jgi:hypothetical protein